MIAAVMALLRRNIPEGNRKKAEVAFLRTFLQTARGSSLPIGIPGLVGTGIVVNEVDWSGVLVAIVGVVISLGIIVISALAAGLDAWLDVIQNGLPPAYTAE